LNTLSVECCILIGERDFCRGIRRSADANKYLHGLDVLKLVVMTTILT